jgi:hypothetical protein
LSGRENSTIKDCEMWNGDTELPKRLWRTKQELMDFVGKRKVACLLERKQWSLSDNARARATRLTNGRASFITNKQRKEVISRNLHATIQQSLDIVTRVV